MNPPTREDYRHLLGLYRAVLDEPAEPAGTRLQLPFERVMRLLNQPGAFNDSLPALFRDVAHRYRTGEPATLAHFRYDENRQFFLRDLVQYMERQSP